MFCVSGSFPRACGNIVLAKSDTAALRPHRLGLVSFLGIQDSARVFSLWEMELKAGPAPRACGNIALMKWDPVALWPRRLGLVSFLGVRDFARVVPLWEMGIKAKYSLFFFHEWSTNNVITQWDSMVVRPNRLSCCAF